jgi:hypothetical protein
VILGLSFQSAFLGAVCVHPEEIGPSHFADQVLLPLEITAIKIIFKKKPFLVGWSSHV